MTGTCKLCSRQTDDLSKHHLIPVTTHRSKSIKKAFPDKQERHRGIMVCRLCHKMIHNFFTEKELARAYNTVEALMADEDVGRFVAWVKKQKPSFRLKKFSRRKAYGISR